MLKNPLSRLLRMLSGDRLETDDPLRLEASLTKLERFVHFCVMVWRSFVRNRCLIRASALSYTTLLALIPMLAVAVGVTSSLLKSQGEERIYQFVDKFVASVMPPGLLNTNLLSLDDEAFYGPFLPGTNPAAESGVDTPPTDAEAAAPKDAQVINAQKAAAGKIYEFVKNTSSGTLGVTGTVLLLAVAFALLGRVEETFNDIWGVTQGRNWLLRIVLYWATITLGPVMLIVAAGLGGSPHLETTRAFLVRLPYIGQLIFDWLPLLMLWLTFALFYKLVPNTKVNLSAAFVGGAVAGTLWHANNLIGFLYVSRVVTYSKIYGALGLVPVFMMGLYFSWVFLLLGAQIAYVFQNRAIYLQDRIAENVNQRGREFIALRLMTCIGQNFQQGLPPPTVQQISRELGVPTRLVQQVMRTLLAARLVVEVHGTESAYAPARPLEDINCHHVLLAMRATSGQELVTRDEPVREEVYGEFARIQAAEKAAAAGVTLLALVNRAQARLQLSAGNPAAPSLVPMPLTAAATASAFVVPPSAASPQAPTPVFPPAEVPTAVEDTLANEPPPADAVASEPEPVDTKPPKSRTDSDEELDFPL